MCIHEALLKRLSRVCTCVVLGQPDAPQQRNAPCVYGLWSVHLLSAEKKSTTLPKECDARLVAQDLGTMHLATGDPLYASDSAGRWHPCPCGTLGLASLVLLRVCTQPVLPQHRL